MIIIDTNYFVALFNKRDKNHIKAKNILKEFKISKWGMRIITDYIVDETITTIWMQTHDKEIVKNFYYKIVLNSKLVKFEKLVEDDLLKAWNIWNKFAEYPKRPLSFTDCTILAVIEKRKIDKLISFDREFEGLVKEIIK